jgi:hypothetical protein
MFYNFIYEPNFYFSFQLRCVAHLYAFFFIQQLPRFFHPFRGGGDIKKPRCYIEAFEYYLFSTGNAITSPDRSLCATTNDYFVTVVSF